MGFFAKKKISEITLPNVDVLRKRTRIIVIDDDENSFPFEIMRNEGYAIDYWPKIQNLGKLERGEYDIIILDIGGVAQEYTHDDGLGILEHLKNVNPAQIVVAFSGQTFDLSKNRFWQMADDSLSKPVDATKCKRIIDNLIKNKMTLSHYWSAVVEILRREQVSNDKIVKLEDKLTRALQHKNESDFSESLNSICAKADLALKLGAIGAKMLALLS
jgi:DNA-binding NtrC family response regulator